MAERQLERSQMEGKHPRSRVPGRYQEEVLRICMGRQRLNKTIRH